MQLIHGGCPAHVQAWRSCKGSRDNTRGYTCGLWQLLHSLAARLEDQEHGGAFWMHTVRCSAALQALSLPWVCCQSAMLQCCPEHSCSMPALRMGHKLES